jgi:hypothetical protein
MSLGTVIGLVLITLIIIMSIVYLVMQADKRRKMHQLTAKAAKKAEATAKRAAWEEWRNR